jgi:hypothetical protein
MPVEAVVGAIDAQGEGYWGEFNNNFWDDPRITNEIREGSTRAGGQAFASSLQRGSSTGGTGGDTSGMFGMLGNLIGTMVGIHIGIADGIVAKKAYAVEAIKREEERAALEQELKEALDFRDEMDSMLSAFLSPVEQQFRIRKRQFGAQARSQGLTGAQAIAAQLRAEEHYRTTIGAQLPGLMQQAHQLSLAQVQAELQKIELREQIHASREGRHFKEDMAAAQAQANFAAGAASLGGALGGGIGGLVDQAVSNNQAQQPSVNESAVPDTTIAAIDGEMV